MQKSSIYLPEGLKHDLAALAARSGRAEADLIRQAIGRLVAVADGADQAAPSPAPRRRGPVLTGVGVGPGDPRHVTRMARDALTAADRVFAMSWTPRSIGRAEMVARATAPMATIERLTYDIAAEPPGRRRSLCAAAEAVVAALDAAEVVAVVTLGDPSMWSVFPDLAAAVTARRPAVPTEMVPGITSYQALAAATATALARAGQTLMVVDGEPPAAGLGDPSTTVVIYKGAPDASELRLRVSTAGRLERAVVGELVGQPGERIEPLEAVARGPVSYLTTVIVPAREGPP
ncbi:MAG: SAM-dependent methyltransferase [Acidimicrobiales bacterium]